MKRLGLFALLVVAVLPSLARALDLTPNESWRMLEGFRLTTLIFKDPKGNIRYQPPGDWTLNGEGSLLSFYPGKQGSFMQFRVAKRGTATKVTGEASEELAKWVRAYLPPDATEVTSAEERPSPFMLGTQPSREYIFNYKAAAQRFTTSISACDVNDLERFVVVITARQAEFTEIHDAGISSLFSWTRRD